MFFKTAATTEMEVIRKKTVQAYTESNVRLPAVLQVSSPLCIIVSQI